MCIIFIVNHVHPKYPLIIASNRDEFFERPTQPMKIWKTDNGDVKGRASTSNDDPGDLRAQKSTVERPKINRHCRLTLSGLDLVGGGTWLGISLPDDDSDCNSDAGTEHAGKEGPNGICKRSSISMKWIAITNIREKNREGRPSRGDLLMEYLGEGITSAHSFTFDLRTRGKEYNGFNLLVGDESGIYYYSNRTVDDQHSNKPLNRGIHGLSNGLLDSSWPKVERGKEMLRVLCSKDEEEESASLESFHEQLMSILSDRDQPPSDEQLPKTWLPPSAERPLSSIFIPKVVHLGRDYGTRSSTTIVVDLEGKVSVLERTWHPGGKDRWFQFDSNGAD